MEENNNNNSEKEFSVDINKEELKNQTKETVNQVKETIKNVDFKKDASATKGFVLEMIKKPFTTINDIVSEKENRFAIAVILMMGFIILSAVNYLLGITEYTKFNFMKLVSSIISPVLYVCAITGVTYVFSGKEKKAITTILSSVVIATIPLIIATLMNIVSVVLVSKLDIIVLGYVISVINTVLMFSAFAFLYIALRELISVEDVDKSFRKIVIIMMFAFAILEVFAILKLYTPTIYSNHNQLKNAIDSGTTINLSI